MISMQGMILLSPTQINMASRPIIMLADPTQDDHADTQGARNAAIRAALANLTAADLANADFSGLPTSDPGIAGRLWNENGAMRISNG